MQPHQIVGYCRNCQFETDLFAVAGADYDPAAGRGTAYELVFRDHRVVPPADAQPSGGPTVVHMTALYREQGCLAATTDIDPVFLDILTHAEYLEQRVTSVRNFRGWMTYHCPNCNGNDFFLARVALS